MQAKITVAICTYNRSFYLEKCLNSLLDQSLDQKNFFILLIDNNSTDETEELVSGFKSKFANFQYVTEKEQGLSYARNRAIETAKTGWIAYIDDDVIVPRNFIERVLDTIASYNFDFFGGAIIPKYLETKPKWLPEQLNRKEFAFDSPSILKDAYITGAIMVMKKKLIIAVGGFPVDLGMKKEDIRYGEEDYVQRKVRKLGKSIGYDPGLLVEHIVASHKLKLKWHLDSTFAHGRDNVKVNPAMVKDKRLAFLLIRSVLAGIFKRTPIALFYLISKKGFYWQNAVLMVLKPIFYTAGKYHSKRNN